MLVIVKKIAARTGAEGDRGRAAFERRETLLEDVFRRIHEAGVDVGRLLEGEAVRAVLRALEIESRRAVHGNRARIGRGVALPAGMQCQGFGMKFRGRVVHLCYLRHFLGTTP